MNTPGPGEVTREAIRLAAIGAAIGGPNSCIKITSAPLVGSEAAGPLANSSGSVIPKSNPSNLKMSVAGLKLIDGSPPTTCRPGVVGAVDPAKGSVLKVNVAAS